MPIFSIYRLTDPENQIFANKVCHRLSTKEELDLFLSKQENWQQAFLIKNEKGEAVNNQLEVYIDPRTSMSSMVDLMKNKFESKKRK